MLYFCVIISISLCRAVLWLYNFLMKLLVWGESLNCSGGITLPKLDHKRPPEQTQLICLVAALINAAQKQVLSVHYRGLYCSNVECMCHTQVAVWQADTLATVLLELACYCSHQATYQQAARAYASIINKMEDG